MTPPAKARWHFIAWSPIRTRAFRATPCARSSRKCWPRTTPRGSSSTTPTRRFGRSGMSDAPEWLADAVEAACRAFCYIEGECPCATAADCGRWWHVSADMRVALAAFLRAVPHNGGWLPVAVMTYEREPGDAVQIPLGSIAAAIERLGAPEKPDAP